MRPTGSSMRLLACGPPGHDGDLEAVLLVGAVGDGLVVAAVLGLGDPVGAERHLGRASAARRAPPAPMLRKAASAAVQRATRVFMLRPPLPVCASSRAGFCARSGRALASFVPGRGASAAACACWSEIPQTFVTHARAHARPRSARPSPATATAIEVPAGARLVFASGQLGIAADDRVPEDAGAQADLCFRAIGAILARGRDGLRRHRAHQRLRDRPRAPEGLHGGPRPLRRRRRRRPRP